MGTNSDLKKPCDISKGIRSAGVSTWCPQLAGKHLVTPRGLSAEHQGDGKERATCQEANNQTGRKPQEFLSGLWATETSVLPLGEFGKICSDPEDAVWGFSQPGSFAEAWIIGLEGLLPHAACDRLYKKEVGESRQAW